MDLNEARQLASRLISPLAPEQVRLEEALGRVLAEDMVADRNLPAESRSRLDGFALRSTDTLGASPATPTRLHIVPGRIAAGHVMTAGLGSMECIRILTGAPLPPCADAVAPQEEVALEGEDLILAQIYGEGKGVMLPGEDAQCGEPLVSAGAVLTPTRLALIAALGGERVAVYRQPHVALLATGDEVKALGAAAEGPYTYCNNMHLLAWLTQLQGGKAFLWESPLMILTSLRIGCRRWQRIWLSPRGAWGKVTGTSCRRSGAGSVCSCWLRTST